MYLRMKDPGQLLHPIRSENAHMREPSSQFETDWLLGMYFGGGVQTSEGGLIPTLRFCY
jgi:hypothetical protein